MAAAGGKSRAVGPDPTQIMLQKNDRIRDKFVRDIKKIGSEEQRSTGDLERQIKDLQKEIRDIQAYTVVYKDHSLVSTDKRRNKPSYTNLMSTKQTEVESTIPSVPVRRPKVKASSAKERRDPFHVKSCLLDVEHDQEIHWETKQPQPLQLVPPDELKKSRKSRLKVRRTNTALNARTASNGYQSLLPGNCTSYYSIRKFYEEEKEKLLHKWSPEERRRQTVKWILNNIKFPEYSQLRRTSTSAIFRDFNRNKKASISEVSSDRVSVSDSQSVVSAGAEDMTLSLRELNITTVPTLPVLPQLSLPELSRHTADSENSSSEILA